jgi:hypothetical protein
MKVGENNNYLQNKNVQKKKYTAIISQRTAEY